MSVLIGHASIDERGKITGGVAGNQTGKEICTRNWYAKNWDYVLRCNNRGLAEGMAIVCEKACKNAHIGYDQSQRNTLRKQAQICGYDLARIITDCECDCSSLMAVCAECVGIPIPYSGGNAPTTRTMKTAFLTTGYFQIITDRKYTASSDYLRRGDILVKEGSHTVMVLSDGILGGNVVIEKPYIKGCVYTTYSNLYIRKSPFGEKQKHSNITVDAQINSHFDEYGYAILNKGTRVTCLDVKELEDSTWLEIPSGWICAINKGAKYIE